MKKFVLASVSALALLGVAACSDSTDNTTTQGVPDATTTDPAPVDPMAPPATDPAAPAPVEPAPAQ
jgi:hypothetical protein